MKAIEALIEFFKKPHEETKDQVPDGQCPVCWGYNEYDRKIRDLYKDKQVDVNNHQASYTFLRAFMVEHVDGIHLQESHVHNCPDCKETHEGLKTTVGKPFEQR
jgi:hypothetical protein